MTNLSQSANNSHYLGYSLDFCEIIELIVNVYPQATLTVDPCLPHIVGRPSGDLLVLEEL